MISIGERLPQVNFRVMTADGPAVRTTDDVFAGRKLALVAVPGAFTPTCDRNHLPGYVEHSEAIRAAGIDAIAVTAVNDVFVLAAWAKASGSEGKVEMLADGNGDFAKAIGLSFDAGPNGLGLRSRRYSMIVRDGVVEALNIEEGAGRAEVSGADALLKSLARGI